MLYSYKTLIIAVIVKMSTSLFLRAAGLTGLLIGFVLAREQCLICSIRTLLLLGLLVLNLFNFEINFINLEIINIFSHE